MLNYKLLRRLHNSLRTLALCRIAGITKKSFEDAVVKVGRGLSQLCLNVLPFSIPAEFPTGHVFLQRRDRDFRELPLTLLQGRPFPKYSLMGSSKVILASAPNLRVLQLRDPLAESTWLAPLGEVQNFDVCVGPHGLQPLDLPALRARRLLPKLEDLIVRWKDNFDEDLQGEIRHESRSTTDNPFKMDSLLACEGRVAISWDGELGWRDVIDSQEEIATTWDM